MASIQSRIDRIMEDRRSRYLFDTDVAAAALGVGPTHVGAWWYRTRRKLMDLYLVQPGQLAAEFACLIAEAEAERQARAEAES